MDAEKCYFAKDSPAIEIRGGLVFIRPAGTHCEIAVTPHVASDFATKIKAALAAWQVEQLDRVEPMPRRA